jgi:hypothetical protein
MFNFKPSGSVSIPDPISWDDLYFKESTLFKYDTYCNIIDIYILLSGSYKYEFILLPGAVCILLHHTTYM